MQTALIAGATSGICAQYARRLAEDGYNLIITGCRETKIKALANELAQSYDSEVGVIYVELSDPVQVNEFIENIKDRDIYLLLNIAGFGTAKFFYHEPLGLQEKMIYAHILAHKQIICVILPQMIEKGAGMIINVSSAWAFLPSPKIAVCNGTKAFFLGLDRILAQGTGWKRSPGSGRLSWPCPDRYANSAGHFRRSYC